MAQQPHTTMDIRFDSPHWLARHLANLGVSQPFHMAQDHDSALPCGQRQQQRRKLATLFRAFRLLIGPLLLIGR